MLAILQGNLSVVNCLINRSCVLDGFNQVAI
jgi:hypothetical protein